MPIQQSPTLFPIYLLHSLPFRKSRHSSNAATATATPPASSVGTAPSTTPTYLNRLPIAYLRCASCLTDLLPTSSIISKGFTGRHGRAYLVSAPSATVLAPEFRIPRPPSGTTTGDNKGDKGGAEGNKSVPEGSIPNTQTHKPVPRQLVTGSHTVSDISCKICGTVLGWKYVDAEEEAQKYKVGKFILETARVVRGVEWESGRGQEATEFALRNGKDSETRSRPGLGMGGNVVNGRRTNDMGAGAGIPVQELFNVQDEAEASEAEGLCMATAPLRLKSQNKDKGKGKSSRRDSAMESDSPQNRPNPSHPNNSSTLDSGVGKGGDGVVEFNSEDEDECEDLFLGIWTPELARRRREEKKKVFGNGKGNGNGKGKSGR